MAVKKQPSIYQLKVTLEDIKPPIWRRILVPSNINLGQFHLVLQIVMGWTNSHLHQFSSGRNLYGMADDDMGLDFGLEMEDETQYQLSDLLTKEKSWLRYEYDFGDGWSHKIVLEKKLAYDPNIKLPSCVKGKRACPPEDCGGVWGYQELLEVIQDPEHPEYEEMLEWLGDELDPEEFNLEETNSILAKYAKSKSN